MAQKEAYGNALSEYQPFVWMKYIQFYIADVPFTIIHTHLIFSKF